MRVIGIDPGVARTGFAVIDKAGPRLVSIAVGAIQTSSSTRHPARLAELRDAVAGLLAEHAPDALSMESLFFNANVKTAVSVAQAGGVILAAAHDAGVDVYDYSPGEVKQSVVGVGNASKRQVQHMVAALLRLAAPPAPPDAADACALAICHLNRQGLRRAIAEASR